MKNERTCALIYLISAAIYVVAYGCVSVVSHQNPVHQEFCPLYAAMTVAAVLHLYVEFRRYRHGGGTGQQGGKPPAE